MRRKSPGLTVQAEHRNAGLCVGGVIAFDHVVLFLSGKSVLGTEERSQRELPAGVQTLVPFEQMLNAVPQIAVECSGMRKQGNSLTGES
jgi:hypothetical protein